MKRIVLLSIGALCIPSLALLGCNERSATKSYDGGVASATKSYDGGVARTANGMDGGLAIQPKTYDGGLAIQPKTYDGGLASAAGEAVRGVANQEKVYDGGLAGTDMDSGSKAPTELHANTGSAAAWEGGLSSRR